MEILEVSVDNSSAVGEVTSSLISRGADVIVGIGDVTVGSPSIRWWCRRRGVAFPWSRRRRITSAAASYTQRAGISIRWAARLANSPPAFSTAKIPTDLLATANTVIGGKK